MSPLRHWSAITCTLVLAGLVASPTVARADFGVPGVEPEEFSAYTLRAEELKLGPGTLRYGLPARFQLGTNFAMNFFGAMNADLKWNIFRSKAFALAVESGFIYFDPSAVGIDETFQVTAVPIKGEASFVVSEALRVHTRVSWLAASPDEQAPDEVIRVQRYLGPVGKLAVEIFFEWRLGAHVALIGEAAVPLLMHAEHFFYEDEDSSANGEFIKAAVSVMGSFGGFNFRAGLGYGPSFLGEPSLFPLVDLYVRIF